MAATERKEHKSMKSVFELADIVRQTGYNMHCYHGHGHLEKVYENALAHRLRKTAVSHHGFTGRR